jgi:ABC-type nitrate/sulfonate/bicarbonate transport system ATPase subunit/ABC-type nitrate/sulfonate/bicarbonate transport system permease component
MKKKLPEPAAVLCLLMAWEGIARYINQPELVPSCLRVLAACGELALSGAFYQAAGVTALRGLAGILLSLAAAGGFALLFSRRRLLADFFHPLLVMMRSIPVVSFILLALIYLHAESIPFLIAFAVMFPLLTENITKGLVQRRAGLNALADTFCMGRKNRALHIYYPQLKPYLFSGLAGAMGFGWRAIIMGEALAQCTRGVGSEMKRAQLFIETPALMAWTIVAVAMGYALDKGISRLERVRIPLGWPKEDAPPPDAATAIVLEDICFAYPGRPVLSGFTHTFSPPAIYGISAPSGKGKTTLLNIINGTLLPSGGSISIDRRRGTACVFQEAELLAHLSVMENALLPLTAFFTKATAVRRAGQVLAALDMTPLAGKRPEELSYGQRQRAAIARALAFPSPVLLLDEPFKGLDEGLIRRISWYLKERQAGEKRIIIFTTHRQEELSRLADVMIPL